MIVAVCCDYNILFLFDNCVSAVNDDMNLLNEVGYITIFIPYIEDD